MPINISGADDLTLELAIKLKTDLIPADIATQLDTNIPAILTNLAVVDQLADELTDAANDEAVLCQAFNTTTTTKNATIVLFALNAIAGPVKDVKVRFFLTADAAATFTVGWFCTRAGAATTFVKRLIPADATIVTPAADAVYEYDFGDLAEGNQLEFRVAQDNAGAATVAIDGVLTYVR